MLRTRAHGHLELFAFDLFLPVVEISGRCEAGREEDYDLGFLKLGTNKNTSGQTRSYGSRTQICSEGCSTIIVP